MPRKTMTKMEKARNVFTKMSADGKSRKSILTALQTKRVGLTANGAATYYQKLAHEGDVPAVTA